MPSTSSTRFSFSIKSSPTGPIICGKAMVRSTIPSYCFLHFEKDKKYTARDLRMPGLNVSSTSKVAPKFHVLVEEYVCQIQTTRRTAQNETSEIADVKENSGP